MTIADLIIENAAILTMDAARPRAQALAVVGNRLAAVGDTADIAALAGPQTLRIDAKGCTVLPGFVEAHMHLFWGGYGLKLLQLSGVQGLAQLAPKLRAYADANPSEGLLICKAADYNLFGPGIATTRHHLDQALPGRPVMLLSSDHHTAWANTVALDRAGLLQGADMPVGCEVVMGADGTATGELREQFAYAPVLALRTSGGREDLGFAGQEPEHPPTATERAEDLQTLGQGLKYCAAFGFTSIHNMDGNFYQLALLGSLEAQGQLICRTEVPYHLTPEKPVSALADAVKMRADYASEKLRSGRVKLFMDGVIDSGTAFTLAPFSDGSSCGALHSAERFNEICVMADAHGLQISVHAIGDAAVRRTLDGYEAAQQANGPRDSRHRIEHIEVLHPDDLPRFAELGVVASIQPGHAPFGGIFPPEGVGKMLHDHQIPTAYAWQDIRDTGTPVVFSTDWPVIPVDVMPNVKAAVAPMKMPAPWRDQSQSLHDTLKSYTADNAWVEFNEARKGRLTPGMMADVAVMSHDLEAMDPQELDKARAQITIAGGRVTYEA